MAKDRRLGLIFGAFLALGGLASIVFAVLNNVDLKGVAAIMVAVGSMVWAVRRSTKDVPPPPKPPVPPEPKQG
jgi:hypothetical protein